MWTEPEVTVKCSEQGKDLHFAEWNSQTINSYQEFLLLVYREAGLRVSQGKNPKIKADKDPLLKAPSE